MKYLTPMYRWLNKSDLKEFKQEQEKWNIRFESKIDLLVDIVVNGNHNPRGK